MDPESDPSATAARSTNRYLRALAILSVSAFAAAVILGLSALTLQRADQSPGDILGWAGMLSVVGFSALLAWLLGAAITWEADR